MPLDDFRCEACHVTEELFVPVSERDSQVHSCGAPLTFVFRPTRLRARFDVGKRAASYIQKDLIDVGLNYESPESFTKDVTRWGEESRNKAWDKIESEALADAVDMGEDFYTTKRQRRGKLPKIHPDAIGDMQ